MRQVPGGVLGAHLLPKAGEGLSHVGRGFLGGQAGDLVHGLHKRPSSSCAGFTFGVWGLGFGVRCWVNCGSATQAAWCMGQRMCEETGSRRRQLLPP